MSDTYTKLFRSITASTIVSEPLATRWLWVTLLAQADASGCVYASVPGLVRLANISREDCEIALACFLAPDPDSRTKENEGRRIAEIDGGWKILNHAKYDAIRGEAERAEYKRQWDRANRPSGHQRQSEQSDESPTQSDTVRQLELKPDSPTPPTPTPTPTKDQKHVRQSARFAEFWALFPVHVGKKPCETKWKARNLDHVADVILADVRRRIANDPKWRAGYVPNPETYINQDRWADGDPSGAVRGQQSAEAPSATDPDYLFRVAH